MKKMNKKAIQYCNLDCQYLNFTVGENQENFGVKFWCNYQKDNPRLLKNIGAEEYRKTREIVLESSEEKDESENFTDKLGDLEEEYIKSFRIAPPEWCPLTEKGKTID